METNQEEWSKTKGWWSFILGLMSVLFAGFALGIAAIILGYKQMHEYPCWQGNVGRILGIIGTVVGTLWMIVLLGFLGLWLF